MSIPPNPPLRLKRALPLLQRAHQIRRLYTLQSTLPLRLNLSNSGGINFVFTKPLLSKSHNLYRIHPLPRHPPVFLVGRETSPDYYHDG